MWYVAVFCAAVWACWLTVFQPERSQVPALPLMFLGLPWAPFNPWLTTDGGQSVAVTLLVMVVCGLINPTALLAQARFLSTMSKIK